jgi:hypothetical protein
MNRDRIYDDPEYPEDNVIDLTREYELTPGPEMEQQIADKLQRSNEDNWGVLIDRIMEDIEEHDLSLEDTIQIWDMGIGAWFNSR